MLVAALIVLAQADPWESRSFGVGALTRGVHDAPVRPLGLSNEVPVLVGDDRVLPVVEPGRLLELIREEVAPESWADEKAVLQIADDVLYAENRRSRLDALAAWLKRTLARSGRGFRVDVALLLVPPELLGKLPPKELAARSKTLYAARLSAASGARVQAERASQVNYVRDHDTQVSVGSVALDPVLDVLRSGERVELRAWPDPRGTSLLFDVRLELAALEGLEDLKIQALKQEAAAPAGEAPKGVVTKDWEALVQLPKLALQQYRGQVLAKLGETVVACALSRADGLLVLTLAPAAPEGGTPPGVLYDVGALGAGVWDWSAPNPERTTPSSSPEGLSLPRPKAGTSIEALLRDLEGEAEAEALGPATLRVRRGREAAEKILDDAFRRDVRLVRGEAALLVFSRGALDDWAKRVPALGPAGGRTSVDALAPLLEAAHKGGDVRVAGRIALSGRIGQRVYGLSGRQRAYVQDFEPHVGAFCAQADPIIGVLTSGVGLEMTPVPHGEEGGFSARLRAWDVAAELAEERKVSTGLGPVQRPRVEGPRWDLEAVCAPGEWTLAALENRGGEAWALFVRID